MKTLFSDIYNRIRELFQIEKSENTSECATNRLQVILMHDRTKLDPHIMNKMREELIDIFSKYVVIDKEELEIGLKNEGDAVALMLNIPIVRAKTEEELEEIRKKLQEEEEKVSDTEDDEEKDESDEINETDEQIEIDERQNDIEDNSQQEEVEIASEIDKNEKLEKEEAQEKKSIENSDKKI